MQDLCVKLFNSWKLKIDFLFPLRASTLRLEPRSHYLFCRREGYMESPGNEAALFMTLRSFCLNLQLLWSVR